MFKTRSTGTCVAQTVKHPTLDFCSDRDFMVHEMEPCVRLCTDSVEPAKDSFSPSHCAPPPPTHALSLPLSRNK